MTDVFTVLPERIGWTLLHSLWQFSLIAACLLLVLGMLRKSSSASRYLAECIALGLMALVATMTFVVADVEQTKTASGATAVENRLASATTDSVARSPSSESAEPARNRVAVTDSEKGDANSPQSVVLPQPEASEPGETSDGISSIVARWQQTISHGASLWLNEIVVGWFLGMLVLSIRPVLGWLGARKLRQCGVKNVDQSLLEAVKRTANRVGVSRVVQVVESSLVDVPTIIGCMKPLILLPASSVTGLPKEQLEAVLAHELAHVRRHDFLVNAIQVLLETLFFYHPAIWWVSRRMRIEREECCDDIAVNITGDRPGYVKLLLWLDQRRHDKPLPVAALSSSGGTLLDRTRRLVRPQRPTTSGSGAMLLMMMLLMLFGGGMWLSADAQDDTLDTEPASKSPIVIDTESAFPKVASRQFAHSVAKQNLPFMDAAEVKAFARELEEYLSERLKEDVAAEDKLIAAAAIDQWASGLRPSSQGYLGFRGNFDMLRWQLWTFAEREPLTLSEVKQRKEQRNWIRSYVRKLPAPERNVEDWQHAARLALVESQVFSNPLSPFFHEPMDEGEFAQFKSRLKERQRGLGANRLIYAPAHIFMAGVYARVDALREKYPPGFPVGGLSIAGTQHFGFRAAVFEHDARYWLSDSSSASPKHFYDADRNIPVDQPDDLGPRDKEAWINEKGVDLHYDSQTGRILPVGGAKLATLAETEWYKIDLIPTGELRRIVESRAAESPAVGPVRTLLDVDKKLSRLPTGILLTADGKVVLFRVEHQDFDSVYVFFRPRPLPPYPPFYNGGQAADNNRQLDGTQGDQPISNADAPSELKPEEPATADASPEFPPVTPLNAPPTLKRNA